MLPQRFTHLRAFSAAAKPTSNFPTPKTKINLPGKVIQQFFKKFLRELYVYRCFQKVYLFLLGSPNTRLASMHRDC